LQQTKPLGLQGRIEVEDSGSVATRPVEAGDKVTGDGIVSEYSDDASPPTVTRMATGRRTSSDAIAGSRS
jgi:hypothetical protein